MTGRNKIWFDGLKYAEALFNSKGISVVEKNIFTAPRFFKLGPFRKGMKDFVRHYYLRLKK